MIYKTITNYKEATKDFLENEKQFHLGVIPTEQSNPLTKNLSATIAKDTAKGVKTILSADKYIADVARGQFNTPEFQALLMISRDVWMKKEKLFFQALVHQEEWLFKWMVLGVHSGKD